MRTKVQIPEPTHRARNSTKHISIRSQQPNISPEFFFFFLRSLPWSLWKCWSYFLEHSFYLGHHQGAFFLEAFCDPFSLYSLSSLAPIAPHTVRSAVAITVLSYSLFPSTASLPVDWELPEGRVCMEDRVGAQLVFGSQLLNKLVTIPSFPQPMALLNHWAARWLLRLFIELLPKQQIITPGKLIVRSALSLVAHQRTVISNRSAWEERHLLPGSPLHQHNMQTDTPSVNCRAWPFNTVITNSPLVNYRQEPRESFQRSSNGCLKACGCSDWLS